eukprot:1190739-Prorocentrum_minimum.AAC.1
MRKRVLPFTSVCQDLRGPSASGACQPPSRSSPNPLRTPSGPASDPVQTPSSPASDPVQTRPDPLQTPSIPPPDPLERTYLLLQDGREGVLIVRKHQQRGVAAAVQRPSGGDGVLPVVALPRHKHQQYGGRDGQLVRHEVRRAVRHRLARADDLQLPRHLIQNTESVSFENRCCCCCCCRCVASTFWPGGSLKYAGSQKVHAVSYRRAML